MRRRSFRACVVASVTVVAAAVAVPTLLPTVASAASTTTWSAVSPIDHQAPVATAAPTATLSCPTTSFCAAAGFGDIETTTDPAATHGAASGWQVLDVDGAYPTVPADPFINAIACPSAALCVAVDSNGNIITSHHPSGGLSAWKVTSVDPGEELLAISCASTSLCVAIGRGHDASETLTSTDPGAAGASWIASTNPTFGTVDGPNGISCPTTTLCVAVGSNDIGISATWTSTDPSDAATASWTALQVGSVVGSDFLAVSCAGTSACVAVGHAGQSDIATDPSAGASAVWHATSTGVADDAITVSCPTAALCVGEDAGGDTITTDPSATTPTWSEKTSVAIGEESISCPSASLCVMPGGDARALTTSDPGDGASATWSTTGYLGFSALNGISCPSTAFCAAADSAGNIATSTDPTSASATWHVTNVDLGIAVEPGGSYLLAGISCPSTALCVAVDDVGNVLVSTNPGAVAPTWTVTKVDNAGGFTAITCRASGLCMAVDFAGDAVVSTNPAGGLSAWKVTNIHGGDLVHYASVSCPSSTSCFAGTAGGEVTAVTLTAGGVVSGSASTAVDQGVDSINGISCPSTALCVAADSAGNVLTSTKPSGPAAGWRRTKIDLAGASNPANQLTDVACSSPTHCVAVDAVGNAISTASPTGSAWSVAHADGFGGLDAVSCPTSTACIAVDGSGNDIVGRPSKTLAIAPTTLKAATVGAAYHAKLTATGGTTPYHWKKTAGALPAGLSLSSTGVISGKPRAGGTAQFAVEATDSGKPAISATRTYRLTLHVEVRPKSLHHGTAGKAYHLTLHAKGGVKPYHWKKSAGSLPAGLRLSAKGVISGTPHKAGRAEFSVRVTDSAKPARSGTRTYTLVVRKAA